MSSKLHRNAFEIYASRECIDNSERNSLYWCIFALAIIYSIPGAVRVQVDKEETRFSYRGFRYVFRTPQKSAGIAKAYDDGKLTKPEISPWHDSLKDPVSVEKIQHRRPKSRVAVKQKQRAIRTKRCSRRRSSRWSGGRM